ncbi:hypothetical protein ACFQ0B_39195 [Nonomuraea thailandensis]
MSGALVPPAFVAWLIVMGAIAKVLFFAPGVRRVDPAVLPELRAIGRVVAEDSETLHEWESSYVEFRHLVIHLDGGDRLRQSSRPRGRPWTGWPT